MIDNVPNEIREATKSVLHLIEATFGKDNEYYFSLNSKQYRPRVELAKGVYYVSKLRAHFYGKENHRAVEICNNYLSLSKKDEKAV
jgi:hypothetical protein